MLELNTGPAQFNFVTIAEWENAAAFENAKAAVTALHRKTRFDPQEMRARLGIRADLGVYGEVVF